jgi:hypothetical protein
MSDLPAGNEPADPLAGDEDLGAGAEAQPFEDYAPSAQDEGYTTAEFHNVVQKQVLNATYETLVETRFHWELVEPFLRAARDVCRGDFRRTGRVEVHGVVAEGEGWTDAEEAYLSLTIADQDDGREWLSETWWLSDLILAAADPRQIREAARALERTVARLDTWLAEQSSEDEEHNPGQIPTS